jgi:alpha-N-acetylglucosamine transferase
MLWFVITRSSCDLFFLELDTFFIVNGNRREEDGMRVVLVENMKNPYESNLGGINRRFKLTLNKLYAWTLVDYERVVMIDSDNIFLQKTDELFQCGQFCAVFINPCYFHTGLFVLQVR